MDTDAWVYYLPATEGYQVGQVITPSDLRAATAPGVVLIHAALHHGSQATVQVAQDTVLADLTPASTRRACRRQVRQARAATATRISKPRNAWIIYRQEKHARVAAAHRGLHNSEICKFPETQPTAHLLTPNSQDHWSHVARRD